MEGSDGAPAPPVSEPRGVARQVPPQPIEAIQGRERDYFVTVLLMVVTLGIHQFYFHYKAHDELCRQLGRRNDNNVLLPAYAVSVLVLLFAGPFILLALIPFGLLVTNQYKTIRDARLRLAYAPRGDSTFFLLWFILGLPILVGPFIAYYNLVQNYNDIWRALQGGAHLERDEPIAAPPAGLAPAPAPVAPAPTMEPRKDWEWTPTPTPVAHAPPMPSGPGNRFSIRDRHPMSAVVQVDYTTRCPHCLEPIELHGPAGSMMEFACEECGETGRLRLPHS